jgi:hypothetical protein
MEKLNCKLAYAVYHLHSGDASARRHASAIRSNSIAFVFVIGHWSLLLLWKCVGSKLLVRGYCLHSFNGPGRSGGGAPFSVSVSESQNVPQLSVFCGVVDAGQRLYLLACVLPAGSCAGPWQHSATDSQADPCCIDGIKLFLEVNRTTLKLKPLNSTLCPALSPENSPSCGIKLSFYEKYRKPIIETINRHYVPKRSVNGGENISLKPPYFLNGWSK